jgi:GWxTD domain-containing protein
MAGKEIRCPVLIDGIERILYIKKDPAGETKMFSKLFITTAFVAVIAGTAMPAGNPGSFVDLDLVRFFPEGRSTILEGYLQISLNAIELKEGPDSEAHIEFFLTLEDSTRKQIYENTWTFEDVITKRMLASEDHSLLQSFSLLLNPGLYTLKLRVSGVKEDVEHEFERQVRAPVDRPLLSDILLANSIEVDTTGGGPQQDVEKTSTYLKDGLLIAPNPCGRFLGATSLVYFYCHVQNQDSIPSVVHLELDIVDADENVVKKLPEKDLKVTGSSRVYVGAFSTGGLREGSYVLRSTARQKGRDGETKSIRVDEPFTVTAKRTMVASYKDVNEYVDFSEEQLDSVFRLMRYLVSNKASDMYESLSLAGKRNFMHEFWKQRDPVPATPENEFRQEYERRISHANSNFGMNWNADAVEGWLTDRGKIYTKFGEPDERITRPNEYGSPPWELWKYYSTGYSYLFIDRTDQELYDLVYTNDKDEPIIPGWERYFPARVLDDIYTEFGYLR